MARIAQIVDKSQLPADQHALFDRVRQGRGAVGGPYSILLHSPGIADRVDQLAAALRTDSELSPTQHVLTALSVARARDSAFIWSVQAPNARRAGVPDTTIAAIGARTTDGLPDDEADLVSYVFQLSRGTFRVDQSIFERLLQRHGQRWLVDLTTTAGHFGLIAGINNAFEVAAAAEGDQLPMPAGTSPENAKITP